MGNTNTSNDPWIKYNKLFWLIAPAGLVIILLIIDGVLKGLFAHNDTFLIDVGPKLSSWAIGIFFTLLFTKPNMPEPETEVTTGKRIVKILVEDMNKSESQRKTFQGGLVLSLLVWILSLAASNQATNLYVEAKGYYLNVWIFVILSAMLGFAVCYLAGKVLSEVKS